MTPLRTGIAFAATVGFFCVLCTVAWVLVPASLLVILSVLFHGMSFDGLVRPTGFDPSGFLLALVALSTAWRIDHAIPSTPPIPQESEP